MVLSSWQAAPGSPYVAVPVSAYLRDRAPICLPELLTNNSPPPLDRDLTTRKETRQKAWEVDGWAETVSKVRGARFSAIHGKLNAVNETDFPTREVDGRLHPNTTPMVSFEVNNRRTVPISVASSQNVPGSRQK